MIILDQVLIQIWEAWVAVLWLIFWMEIFNRLKLFLSFLDLLNIFSILIWNLFFKTTNHHHWLIHRFFIHHLSHIKLLLLLLSLLATTYIHRVICHWSIHRLVICIALIYHWLLNYVLLLSVQDGNLLRLDLLDLTLETNDDLLLGVILVRHLFTFWLLIYNLLL